MIPPFPGFCDFPYALMILSKMGKMEKAEQTVSFFMMLSFFAQGGSKSRSQLWQILKSAMSENDPQIR